MSRHRFFLSADQWSGDLLLLGDEEAHHCLHVMRCRIGDCVVIFDGAGRETEARIQSTTRSEITLEKGSERSDPPHEVEIVLAQSVLKGKNMEWIIQKATELGASRIIPLLSEHTVVQVEGDDAEKKRQKWQRIALEACKQCGQNWLPRVEAPIELANFIHQGAFDLRLVAALTPEARPLKRVLSERQEGQMGPPSSAVVMIGPEGDFTPEEINKALEMGFQSISLGPVVLRSETAAIHSLGMLVYELRS